MGTDYTLACRACKKAANIDRHGRTLRGSGDYVEVTFNEKGLTGESRAMVQPITVADLEAGLERYLTEGAHGWNLHPVMVEWVRAHELHEGGVVLLNDGLDYSEALAHQPGWTTEYLLEWPGLEEIVSTPASEPFGETLVDVDLPGGPRRIPIGEAAALAPLRVEVGPLSSPRGELWCGGKKIGTVTNIRLSVARVDRVYVHVGPGKNPACGLLKIAGTPEAAEALRKASGGGQGGTVMQGAPLLPPGFTRTGATDADPAEECECGGLGSRRCLACRTAALRRARGE